MSREDHWLFRLGSDAWLAAAGNELASARAAVPRRRTSLTHARRSAGMALNAVLVHASRPARDPQLSPEDAAQVWGRSYIDHIRSVAGQAPLFGMDAALREHCELLVKTPIMGPQAGQQLVQLRPRGDDELEKALEAALQVSAICASAVEGP